jgi:hypothetical protein
MARRIGIDREWVKNAREKKIDTVMPLVDNPETVEDIIMKFFFPEISVIRYRFDRRQV